MTAADRTTQMLERLAEMDLAAAEHVHAQLLAATEPKAVSELARAYQRAGRALRQVLMLRMRHEAAQAEAACRAPPPKAEGEPVEDSRTRVSRLRLEQIQDAVGRVAARALATRPRHYREALDRLDVLLDDWWDDDDKLVVETLDDLVQEACEELGLPRNLAVNWEQLPRPVDPPDPASRTAPTAETG